MGAPGATQGLQARDITIAQALKPLGYATGQFGKNHLGDRDEFLPTNHGFDEFFGNLYHLNAEEEPERPYWPSNNPDFLKSYNPRGVIHSFADGKINDTGPLNVKRMQTIDDETTQACADFITKQAKAGTPFFTWMNFTRMHVFTHVRPEYEGKAGMGKGFFYADGMWEMDQNVGKLLKLLDDLQIAKDTIVVFTTDNGPNAFTWPDAATTPFRSEKDSNWEGAFRVPAMVRWPGHIKAGEVSNELFSGLDWFPTLLAAAGDATVKDRPLKGSSFGGKTFKVHLDGYNQLPYLTGKEEHSARERILLLQRRCRAGRNAVRRPATRGDQTGPHGRSCSVSSGSRVSSISGPIRSLVCECPRMFNLRMDPYEHAQISGNGYDAWRAENAYLIFEAVEEVGDIPPNFRRVSPQPASGEFLS